MNSSDQQLGDCEFMSINSTSSLVQRVLILLRPALLVFFSCSGTASLWAQSAELSGIVKDPQDAAIPGAALSLVSSATSTKYQAETTDKGYYVFRGVSPGKYVLKCSANGFGEIQMENLTLDSGTRRQQDLGLRPPD